jgi:succinylarginine dihydrolase
MLAAWGVPEDILDMLRDYLAKTFGNITSRLAAESATALGLVLSAAKRMIERLSPTEGVSEAVLARPRRPFGSAMREMTFHGDIELSIGKVPGHEPDKSSKIRVFSY